MVKKWLETKNEFRPMETIEPQELDVYLAQFFLSVRKYGTGNLNTVERQYGPTTLLAIHSAVFRHFTFKESRLQNQHKNGSAVSTFS